MNRNTSSIQAVVNTGFGGFDSYQSNAQQWVQTNPLPQKQTHRTVLGVISENEQRQRSFSLGAASMKLVPGIENAFLFPGKLVSTNAATMAPRPSFTIYVDEPAEVPESQFEVELSSMEEMDANIIKQQFNLLLDVSAASPMIVDTSFPPQTEPEDTAEMDPDAIAVSEYTEEIHHYLREAEVKYRPKPFYMRKQPDITSSMRTILVDWLVEVRDEYKLRNETLFLAVNYLDRFLSSMSVLRGKLQLVGTAAILLASKYEEIYPPEVDEFVYITDDTYTKKQLLRMEHLLLKVLAFDLTVPTINQFLMQYIHKHAIGTKTEHLAMPDVLQNFTGYTLSDIAPCLADLHRACLNAPHQPQQAIQEKYRTPKYMQVSHLAIPAVLPL
uniref:Cyclin-like domain-containing protein n=1 Tax=Pyxicephalus adspersus TaxID=30357 RepID=A0AAV3B3D0_PYXAD|nr:TPA: hypothetical protein GDO54_000376 [Pyxicephalus adspersus]